MLYNRYYPRYHFLLAFAQKGTRKILDVDRAAAELDLKNGSRLLLI